MALKVVQGNDDITIDKNNLEEFVGKPVFKSDRIYESTPPGVVMGLAWTALGKCNANRFMISIIADLIENALPYKF